MFFNNDIIDMNSWSAIFQSLSVFDPLIMKIFKDNNLEYQEPKNCEPGSNAVFKVGKYIIKIFAPDEAQLGSSIQSYEIEKNGMNMFKMMGLPTPKIYAYGIFNDKYPFPYIIMEFINGITLKDCNESLTNNEKENIGKELRRVTSLINKCSHLKMFDIKNNQIIDKRWENFPESFQKERLEYLKHSNKSPKVFIHGDLTNDHIIVKDNGEIQIIDFADSRNGIIEEEYATLISEAFQYNPAYLFGFFANYENCIIIDTCISGMLTHIYGANIIKEKIEPEKIISINALKIELNKLMSTYV